jgi:MFS superfamily sulfate permease-like transporter
MQGKEKQNRCFRGRGTYQITAYTCLSAVQILYEIVESYHQRHIQVYFVRLRERPSEMFERSGLLDLIGSDHRLRKVSEAIEAVERDMANESVVVEQW